MNIAPDVAGRKQFVLKKWNFKTLNIARQASDTTSKFDVGCRMFNVRIEFN